MTNEQKLDQRLEQLSNSITPDPSFTTTVMDRINMSHVTPSNPTTGVKHNRTRNSKWIILASCAAIIATIWIWSPTDQSSNNASWWLGSPSVYAKEIETNLSKARVNGIIFTNKTIFVMKDGSKNTSSTVGTYFMNAKRYRHDIYNEGNISEIQWYVPEGNELIQTSYQLKDESIKIDRHKTHMDNTKADPLDHIMKIVRSIDQANKIFPLKEIDGHQCIGFEIDANKVRNTREQKNDKGLFTVWFEVKTKRPVKILFDRTIAKNKLHKIKRMISIYDKFEWNPDFPEDLFIPKTASKK